MRHLLVIEDDVDIRSAVAELFTASGYSVCQAGDGPTGLTKLRSLHPDLVVLDYGLPGPSDGEAFLEEKAGDAEIASVPVVVMSGYNLPLTIDGTVAVVQKPFDEDELVLIVKSVVGPP